MSSVIPNPGAKECLEGCGTMDAWKNNAVVWVDDDKTKFTMVWYRFQQCWTCGHKERERLAKTRN